MDPGLTFQEEQEKHLKEHSNNVKRSGFYMNRALDEDNLRDALKYSSALLGEMRTSLLTPQNYFRLYMQVFDELRHLEAFFSEEGKKGRSYRDLYELVQHAGNALPRLYLLCTVGSCYIRSKEAAAKDILKDLVELCKGVQHPTRGLFLRSYLCQVSKGLLPDVGSEYEGEGGDITDALAFLLQNFTEMNKLWVRMQHQGSARDKDRREKERQQLADLVGKNLTYVSQLDGLDFTLYQEKVLPNVMEQIINCKDDIAQQYLMQCVIQGFPDEFHLGTLDVLLGACPELQPGVKVHTILASLVDRLAKYAATDGAVRAHFEKVDAFSKLRDAAERVAEMHTNMPAADVVAMFISLLQWTCSVFPTNLDRVNDVLAAASKALQARSLVSDTRAEKQLVTLLSIPLDTYDVVQVLQLVNYPHVMSLLTTATRKEMSKKIVGSILKNGTKVSSVAKVEMLFDFIMPLIGDASEDVPEDEDESEIEEEQFLVAKLVHQLHTEDTDEQFEILKKVEERLSLGGDKRRRHTLPPIAFCSLAQLRKIKAREDAGDKLDGTCHTVLHFVGRLIDDLSEMDHPETAVSLYLQAGISASEVAQLELIASDMFEQALVVYEEKMSDSRALITGLNCIVGALHRCRVFSAETRQTLVHKALGFASVKLLKKADQCRAVCASSHLWWQLLPTPQEDAAKGSGAAAGEEGGAEASPPTSDNGAAQPPVRDPEQVLSCLKRSLKIANNAQRQLGHPAKKVGDTGPVHMFVEILNTYLYYFDDGLPTIPPSVLQSLLDLVANEMAANEACKNDRELQAFYKNTKDHIAAQKKKEGVIGEKYAGLKP